MGPRGVNMDWDMKITNVWGQKAQFPNSNLNRTRSRGNRTAQKRFRRSTTTHTSTPTFERSETRKKKRGSNSESDPLQNRKLLAQGIETNPRKEEPTEFDMKNVALWIELTLKTSGPASCA
ncbi:unnamed protein product [Lathyrus oleraceus]